VILSNTEIFKALDEGRLEIRPEPLPRVPRVKGDHCPYDTHSVDLTLGDTILVPVKECSISINLAHPGNVTETIKRHSTSLKITEDQPYMLQPNTFVLGNTREFISLPLQKHAGPFACSTNRRQE
jgi:deoxycytidine triphosphate deaminase